MLSRSMLSLIVAALAILFCAAPVEVGSRFENVTVVPTGAQPAFVVTADLNGDGATDIAAANGGANDVSIIYGDGFGRFSRPTHVAALPSPHLLATADADDNGRLDLFVTAHDSNEVVVLLNGEKAFIRRAVTAFSGPGAHNHGLALGDLNGDGKVDITAGHQDRGSIALLLGDGRGLFRSAPQHAVTTGAAPYPHALADLNGDKRLDLAVPAVRGDSVGLFLNAGGSRLTPAATLRTGVARPFFVAAADFTGDGHVDLAVNHDDSSKIAILVNNGKGSFRPAAGSPFDGGERSWNFAVSDLNLSLIHI